MISELATSIDDIQFISNEHVTSYNNTPIGNMYDTYIYADITFLSVLGTVYKDCRATTFLANDILRHNTEWKTLSGNARNANLTSATGTILAVHEKTKNVVSSVDIDAEGNFSFQTPYYDEHILVCYDENDSTKNALVYAKVIPK